MRKSERSNLREGYKHNIPIEIMMNAINMFYKQIILQRGLPFEVKIPAARVKDVSAISDSEMDAELEKGYADMKAGRTKSAKSTFADIRKDYGIDM